MSADPVLSFTMTFHSDVGFPGDKTMSFIVTEDKPSRGINHPYKIVYTVRAEPHSDTIMGNYLEYVAGGMIDDELIIGWNVWEVAGDTFLAGVLVKKWPPVCTRLNDNQYQVTINYAPLFITDFEVSTLRTKRMNSFVTSTVFKNDGESSFTKLDLSSLTQDERDSYTYINVDEEGEVHGVEALDPIFNWTERWSWGPQGNVYAPGTEEAPEHYLNHLLKLATSINSAPFRGFKAGEVMFRTASGRYVSPMLYEIDYNFAARPNKTYINFGGKIAVLPTGTAQSGWNLVDVELTKPKEILRGDGRRVIAQVPDVMKIHRIFPVGDFGDFGIRPNILLTSANQYTAAEGLPVLLGHAILTRPIKAIITNLSPA